MPRESICILLLALVFSSCGEAPPPAAEAGYLASLSEQTLEQPIGLATGIGDLHQPVTTESEEAQLFYDQGLAYLASFDWLRAARSFHASLRADPGLAMAHLGLARAYLGLESPAQAQRRAEEAERVDASVALEARERRWIELGGLQMRAVLARGKSLARKHEAFKRAIEGYLASYPDDVHALVLRGNVDSRPDGWGQAGLEGSVSWYQQALELDPNHFPARHFLTHAFENLGRHEEAREHALHYAALAPEVPHAHHMLAHVAPRLGRWEEARDELEEADGLHRQSFAAGEVTPREDWHYGHNLRLLAAVHLRLGNEEKAEQLYRNTFQLDYAGRRAGFYCVPWVEYLLSRERFDEALSAAQTCERRPSQLARAVGAGLRGEALLGLGRADEARQALAQAKKRRQELLSSLTSASAERMFAFAAGLSVQTLEGKIELHDGDFSRGESLLLGVVESLSSGHSFDAWALGRLRVEEIATSVSREGYPELASTVVQRQRRLEKAVADRT